MQTLQAPKLRLHACSRCAGDLILDEDAYVCLQCGRASPIASREYTTGRPLVAVRQGVPAGKTAAAA